MFDVRKYFSIDYYYSIDENENMNDEILTIT